MKDYARKRPRSTARKPAASDQRWLSTGMLFLSAVFVLCAGYHFVEERDAKTQLVQTAAMPSPASVPAITPEPQTRLLPPPIPQVAPTKQTINTPAPITKSKTHSKHAAKPQKPIPPADVQPKYDFYKLLPEMTVNVPQQNQAATPGSTTTASGT